MHRRLNPRLRLSHKPRRRRRSSLAHNSNLSRNTPPLQIVLSKPLSKPSRPSETEQQRRVPQRLGL